MFRATPAGVNAVMCRFARRYDCTRLELEQNSPLSKESLADFFEYQVSKHIS